MSRQLPKVRIVLTAPNKGKVSVDGVELPFVTRVMFTASVDRTELPHLWVEMHAGEVEVEGGAEVVLSLRESLPLHLRTTPRGPECTCSYDDSDEMTAHAPLCAITRASDGRGG